MKQLLYSQLGRPAFQPMYDRLLGYLLRLKGYNNYPEKGGDLDLSGENWFIANVLAQQCGVCLDIGANKGEYSLELLRNTPATQVYSIEPLPQELAVLRTRLAPYAQRCVIVPCAISNVSGKATLRYNPSATETASISAATNGSAYRHDSEVTVNAMTIDDLVAHYNIAAVDFIKIDVEGAEMLCLQGARRTIERLRPRFIQLEFHWHHLFGTTSVHVMQEHLNGYRAYRLLPKGFCRIDARSTLDNIYAYSNIVFARDAL